MGEPKEPWEKTLSTIDPELAYPEAASLPPHFRVGMLDTQVQALLELGHAEDAAPIVEELLEADWGDPTLLELCEENGLRTSKPAETGAPQ